MIWKLLDELTGAGLLAGIADAKGSVPSKPPEGFGLLGPPRLANMLLVSMLEEMLAKGSTEVLAGAGFGALNVLGVKPEGFTLGVKPEGLARAAPKGSLLFCAVEVAIGTGFFGAASKAGLKLLPHFAIRLFRCHSAAFATILSSVIPDCLSL